MPLFRIRPEPSGAVQSEDDGSGPDRMEGYTYEWLTSNGGSFLSETLDLRAHFSVKQSWRRINTGAFLSFCRQFGLVFARGR